MIASTVFLCLAIATSDARPVLPAHMHLVEGLVVDAKASRAYCTNKIRINRVYGPEEDLAGREFSANSADHAIQGNMRPVIPRLRVGERGIWVVSRSNGDVRKVDVYNYIRWPVREAGGRQGALTFETAKEFAEAIEHVYTLRSAEEATAALERLATDANPYISSWAISRLPAVSVGSVDAVDFLDRLVHNPKVPIQGQVELDQVQIGTHGPVWERSEARLKLFLRWFAGTLSERDAGLVVTQLDLAAQHPGTIGFSQHNLLLLTTLLIENDRFPMPQRRRAGTVIKWTASRYESDDMAFDSAVRIVSSDLPEELRVAVAAVFVNEFVLNDDRRKILTKLRDAAIGMPIIRLLNKTLARPNGNPARPFVFPGGRKRSEPFTGRASDDEAE